MRDKKLFGKKPKGKGKPPSKTSMEALVGRKLDDTEINERRGRFQLKFGQKLALEKRRRSVTREINGELKDLNNELELLHEQILHGEEQVKQGDLFADGATHSPSKDQTAKGLAELAKRAGVTPPADGKGKGSEASA